MAHFCSLIIKAEFLPHFKLPKILRILVSLCFPVDITILCLLFLCLQPSKPEGCSYLSQAYRESLGVLSNDVLGSPTVRKLYTSGSSFAYEAWHNARNSSGRDWSVALSITNGKRNYFIAQLKPAAASLSFATFRNSALLRAILSNCDMNRVAPLVYVLYRHVRDATPGCADARWCGRLYFMRHKWKCYTNRLSRMRKCYTLRNATNICRPTSCTDRPPRLVCGAQKT